MQRENDSFRRRAVAPRWVLPTLALLPLVFASSVQAGPDLARVEYAYAGSGAADGAFAGTCQALGIRWAPEAPGNLAFASKGGTLHLVETWANYTVYRGSAYTSQVFLNADHVSSYVSIPSGALDITWSSKGLASLFAPGYPLGPVTPIPLRFHATHLEWSGVTSHLPGPSFWYPMNEGTYRFPGGYPGWKRELTVTGDALALESDVVLYLREASIRGRDGFAYDLPSFQTEVSNVSDPTGRVSLLTIRTVDSFLDLQQGGLELSSTVARPVCAGLDAAGEGAVTMHAATGRYSVGGESGSFEQEALTFAGNWSLRESPRAAEPSPNERGWVDGSAEGRIEWVGRDFHAVLAAAPAASPIARVAFWTLTVAGGFALLRALPGLWASLYTRLVGEAALGHPRRALLLDFAKSHPGCSVADAARGTGLARGVLRYHLLVLARSHQLREVRWGGQRRLFACGAEDPGAPARWLAERDERLHYLAEAARGGPVVQSELVRQVRDRFAASDGAARKWIARAVRLGLLTRTGVRKRAVYACAS